MKRLIIGMTAAMALALTGTARADDTKTTESKTTVKHSEDGTGSVKSEKKAKSDPKGGMNATTDSSTYSKDVDKNTMGGTTTKVEKKAKHDAPGMASDSKLESKETIEKDASGNVVKHEKSGPDGKTVEVK
ncbi:MAG: hypothetical protein EHM78_19830 [Myxococcaceae bacterium]|nr:MAG: hypothetical protein EHM78_19830 [Myxococcaceae bacterium]